MRPPKGETHTDTLTRPDPANRPNLTVIDGRIIDTDAGVVLSPAGDDLIDANTGEIRARVADLPGGAA